MIKKSIIIVVVSILLVSCKSKEIKGVWMYSNDRSPEYGYEWTQNVSGIVFDFDNSKAKILFNDTIFDAQFKFRKKFSTKLFGIREKVGYKIIHNNEIEFESKEDEVKVFKRLDLNHKLNFSKEEIIDFLVNAKLQEVSENGLYDSVGILKRYLELNFKKDFYKYDETKSLRTVKNNYFENDNDVGYWYVGEFQNNFFLFFSGDWAFDTNTYQILSLSKTEMKLKALFESEISGIKELITK